MKAAARQFDTVLLSDELIWHHWLKQPDFWQRLIQEVQNMNSTLKVVVYLRRQDLLAESLYNHIVKSKRMFTKDFSSYINGQAPKIFAFSYYEQIQQIASWIGKEYLLLRVYEEGQFGGEEHTLFSDFLRRRDFPRRDLPFPILLPIWDCTETISNSNESSTNCPNIGRLVTFCLIRCVLPAPPELKKPSITGKAFSLRKNSEILWPVTRRGTGNWRWNT